TPLPGGLTLTDVGSAIPPEADVDGANPVSLGLLAAGAPDAFPPATAAAVLRILDHEGVDLVGRRAVVIGRSNVVGKPAALMLLSHVVAAAERQGQSADAATRRSSTRPA